MNQTNILRPRQIQTTGNTPNAYTMDHASMLNISSTAIGLQTTGNPLKCLLDPFIPVFFLTTMTNTKASSQLKLH